MDAANKMPPQTSLFQVYLRLRPPITPQMPKQPADSWLIVEPPAVPIEDDEKISCSHSTHITLQPPNESRKRAIERFGFTKIFKEEATQMDIFEETGTAEGIRHVLENGRDALVATLGVTGSGKSHTILGSKSQRGLTQMTLDVLFRSIGQRIRKPHHPDLPSHADLLSSLQSSDPSEAQILSATTFLESIYSDGDRARLSRAQTPMSRAQTPMTVRNSSHELPGSYPSSPPSTVRLVVDPCPRVSALRRDLAWSSNSVYLDGARSAALMLPTIQEQSSSIPKEQWHPPSKVPFWNRLGLKKSPAKSKPLQETLQHVRKPPLPNPNTFAQQPDVSSYSMQVDQNSDYVVLVSMYEVYNDRIFDLLSNTASPNGPAMSTRQGAALQKGLMRRPLLFKNTEMSPDRKVVAGLRKIVCGSYEEAMTVLETGLTERRVAGTGSNSVSSRSHGFFCIEVKKNSSMRFNGMYAAENWAGGTFSIVDLAGSERARNAKTTGSTLAEAGKINESLMYLGQCLQVQSDCQHDGSKPIVPFRQCKLTELLFSNSFPSSSNPNAARPPQKAVMIVTADPEGDFNATSQILRYSALAREVTVPRVPSVTSTILCAAPKLPYSQSGRNTPHDYFSTHELEQAAHEIARLTEECDILAVRVAEEEIKRTEAELQLQAAEERALAMEQEVREECWAEMEERVIEEKERWRDAWEAERRRGEEYVDGKLEILEKTTMKFTIHADQETGREDELERENELLRAKVRQLEQEMQMRSPTKKSKSLKTNSPFKSPPSTHQSKGLGLVLQETSSNANIATNPFLASLRASPRTRGSEASDCTIKGRSDAEGTSFLDVSPRKLSLRSSGVSRSSACTITSEEEGSQTVKKKTRKLTTRKWDLGDPELLG